MGRYYSGDIDGKFMFGIQSSTSADRFGSTYNEPSYVEYYFDEDQLDTIKEQLEILKDNYIRVAKYFEDKEGYTDQDTLSNGITKDNLSDYADYVLGEKIMDCIIENGSCSFDAEL